MEWRLETRVDDYYAGLMNLHQNDGLAVYDDSASK